MGTSKSTSASSKPEAARAGQRLSSPITRRRSGRANMDSSELQKFLAVLQSGDPEAVEELLRQLDPFLRQVIRMQLLDGRLQHITDTTDVLQSLLKDFLARIPADQPSGNRPGSLQAYL